MTVYFLTTYLKVHFESFKRCSSWNEMATAVQNWPALVVDEIEGTQFYTEMLKRQKHISWRWDGTHEVLAFATYLV